MTLEDQIRELAGTLSMRAIAKRLGVTRDRVRYICNKFGIETHQGIYVRRFSFTDIDTIESMVEDGSNSLEIAHRLGVPAEAIRRKIVAMGLVLRHRIGRFRVRMVLDVPRILQEAATARGITPQMLIRRILKVVCRDRLIDAVLDDAPVAARISLIRQPRLDGSVGHIMLGAHHHG